MELYPAEIIIQLGLFLLIYWLLNRFVFRPFLTINQLRLEQTDLKIGEAEDKHDQAEKLQQEYEEAIAKAKIEAREQIQAAMETASSESKNILQEARSQGQDIFSTKKQEVSESKQAMIANIDAKVPQVADEIYSAIVQ